MKSFIKFTSFAIIVLISLILMGFSAVSEVQACSGGASDNIQDTLANATYVVKADIVSVDDVRQNAILHVDRYLYGGPGPEYLLLVQNDPVIINRIIKDTPVGTCDFFGEDLNLGLTAYFFLTRRPDGIYKVTTAHMPTWATPTYYDFSERGSSVQFYSREGEVHTEHILDERAFVEFVTHFGQSTLVQPQEQSIFPRLAPLKLTTANGTDYVLPVDSGVPIKATEAFLSEITLHTLGYSDNPAWNEQYFNDSICPGADCIQVSPDGINRAWQDGDQIRWFGGYATGQVFSFSSTGEVIVVWDNNKLELYIYGPPGVDYNDYRILQSISLSDQTKEQLVQSAWTTDGRSFAYSDADGLWLLEDVYDEAALPVKLLPGEENAIPTALKFSPLGHYLQVERGDERFTLHLESGDVLPDGLISPDDRFLLAYDTRAEFFDIEVCSLTPVEECQPVPILTLEPDVEDYRGHSAYQQVQWRNTYSFFTTVCAAETHDPCVIAPVRIERLGDDDYWRHNTYELSKGYTFDYSSSTDLLAVVQDNNWLAINGEEYNLVTSLDSPIISVEWLPSLFYKASDF
jgi:hypothetical protein